jgi:Flp pilus assembly protein TadG
MAPLTAVLLVPLLGVIAFAVDMGYVTHTQNELQSAADAAALAGAARLSSGYVSYYLPGVTSAQQATALSSATSNARTYARNYAGYNTAGSESLTLLDRDIEYGYTDSSGNYTALANYDSSGTYTPLSQSTTYPNTMKVTLRRDGNANGALGLFFARVLGINSVNLTATAAATIYAGSVNGFNTTGPFIARILPMTYDVNHWPTVRL